MQLIGQAIRHDTFGKGLVTDWDMNILTVCFSAGDKKFIYPDAFCKHLTLKNSEMQNKIQSLLDVKAAKKEAERQAIQEELERKSLLRNLKISPISQAAVNITEDQEANLFSAWSISTGTYLSGSSKGEPRIPERMKPNSLCLLTQRKAGTQEEDRHIIGAFMVEEDFFGVYCRNGVVNAHPDYRIMLATEKRLAFWPYVTEVAEKQRWGNTTLKYFSNKTAEKILFDMMKLSNATPEYEAAHQFYQYFCKINRLPVREVEDENPCD